jgi:dienelactone hydrolase
MRRIALPLLAVLCGLQQSFAAEIRRTVSSFASQAGEVEMDEYVSDAAVAGAIILLSGSGGVKSPNMPFDSQARLFAAEGYRIYLPHYLDVTHGSPRDPIKHYAIWAQAVHDAISYIQTQTRIATNRIALVGYSLGASVALAAAAGGSRLAGIVVWSGSLPDAYVSAFERQPPLLILHGDQDKIIPFFNAWQLAELCNLRHGVCKLNIYPGEGHAFSSKGIAQADRQVEVFLKTVLPSEKYPERARNLFVWTDFPVPAQSLGLAPRS